MSAKLKLPNFFIVGAPKAGTTSVYAYLDQHPQIYMSPLKETHYFSEEIRAEHFSAEEQPRLLRDQMALAEYLRTDMREKRFGGLISEWRDYLRLFEGVQEEIAIGEATPHYLWSASAAANIAARVPHAKIIIILRNPADRAFSHYLHMVTAGAVRRSFREQIEASLHSTGRVISTDWPFLEYGCYHGQVLRYLREFPRAQIHIAFYDDLQSAAPAFVAALFTFLGVARDFPVDVSLRHNEPQIPRWGETVQLLKRAGLWPYVRKLAPPSLRPRMRAMLLRSRTSLVMAPAERALLTDYYRDEIARLAVLLGRDLRSWLEPQQSTGVMHA